MEDTTGGVEGGEALRELFPPNPGGRGQGVKPSAQRRGGVEDGTPSRGPQIVSGLSEGVLTTGEEGTSGDHSRKGVEPLHGARIPANG